MSDGCERPPAPLEEGTLGPWLDVARQDRTPFVHRFRTAAGTYVYDVNTRRIIRVSPAVWDIIEEYGGADERLIAGKHAPKHGAEEVRAAMKRIGQAQEEEGLLLSFRPAKVLPPSERTIGRKLEESREQLILGVTEDCNFRCSYCVFGGAYANFPPRSSKAMDWEVARLAIDEFLAHSAKSQSRVISFYGGEPLLNLPLIRRCVSYVRGKRAPEEVRFSTTTNGSLLEGEAAELLGRERFLILLSLDGPGDMHDLNRKTVSGGPTWETICSNLERFLASHPEYRTNGALRFNAVVTQSSDLVRLQEFWIACGLFTDSMGLEVNEKKQLANKPMDLRPLDPLAASVRALHEQFADGLRAGRFGEESEKRARWVQAALFQRPLAMFHKRGYLKPHLPATMTLLSTCIPGARRTFVSTLGEYFACERVAPCSEQSIGDVHGGVSPARVMRLLEDWAQASGDQCRFCWCVSHCNVGCFATLEGDGPISSEGKRRGCARYRQHMDRQLREYVSILEANPRAFDYTAKFQFT
jgi:uncharacterized protein